MRRRHRQRCLPKLWLVSDARNDAVLDRAILRLPPGSGVVFRHGHLPPAERRQRFVAVRRLCRRRRHWLVLAGSAAQARRWGADGAYGRPAPGVALATAHSLAEIGRANRWGAQAVLLSPVFATRSHPGARPLGRVRFLLLARRSRAPAVALGGMTAARARLLRPLAWAAIDALSSRHGGVALRTQSPAALPCRAPPQLTARAASRTSRGEEGRGWRRAR